jgi:superfamily II DNA or RNA helicase
MQAVVHVPAARAVLVPPHIMLEGEKSALVKYKGEQYRAYDHVFSTALRLRDKGLNVDSPMNHGDFEYTGRFQPFLHQKVTAAFLSMYHRAFCFNELGTGKTAACVWAAEYMRKLGLIRRVLVLCPITTMRDVWEAEIMNCARGVPVEVLRGSVKAKRAAIADPNIPWLILNHDGIKTDAGLHLLAQGDIDLIICDEATAYKTPGADRTKSFIKLVQKDHRRLWALTGTPMAKLPTDVYTNAKLICPDKVPASFSMFEGMTCFTIGLHKKVPKRNAVEQVLAVLEPAICYRKSECIDLPPLINVDREVELSPQQTRIIKELTTKFVSEVAGKKITALAAQVQAIKVLQVLQGGVITDSQSGAGEIIGAPGRLAVLRELIDASNSKSVVFAPFKLSIRYLREALADYGVGVIDGTVPEVERANILRRFASEDSGMQVLLAHPKTTGHGLTLTAASTLVWYGPIFSPELYLQGCGRIDRPGQKHHMSVYNLHGHPNERQMYAGLQQRIDMQELLLNAVKSF